MTTDSMDRPNTQGAAMVAVIAAFVVGIGAVGASSVLTSAAPRVLVAIVLVAAGWAVTRLANDPTGPAPQALGEPVLRGIGTSVTVLGAYLLGLALLTATIPDSPGDSGPSAVAVVLLVYGVPALGLLAVAASTRMRAWAVGVGAIVPMLVVALLLTAAEVGTGAVSITMLVAGVLLAAVAVRALALSAWGDVASAAAAMSASFAFGAGTSPFGSLGTTQTGGAAAELSGSGLTGAGQIAVTGGALLVGAVVLVVAVLRRDLASGILVGSMFAMPPLMMQQDLGFGVWQSGTDVVLIGVPALAAVIALAALRSPVFRRALVAVPVALRTTPLAITEPIPVAPSPSPHPAEPGPAHRTDEPTGPGDAVSAAACAVVVAAAAVVFVSLAMPGLGWDWRLQGAVSLVVLAGVGALAFWLPGTAGAAAAVVALLGFALATPWIRLLTGGDFFSTPALHVIAGVLDLVVAAALSWLLIRRHRRVGVAAASAYLLAGALAVFLSSLLFNPAFTSGQSGPYSSDWAPLLVIALPLVLLSLPAAVLAFGRWAPFGQAVGAVALAAAGFLPMKSMVGEFVRDLPSYALQASLAPLTPTDQLGALSSFRAVTGPALGAVIVMVLVAFVLAASLARRPSAPLAGALALLLLSAVQASLLTALAEWSADEASALGWGLGAAALVAAVVAVVSGLTAAQRAPHPAAHRSGEPN